MTSFSTPIFIVSILVVYITMAIYIAILKQKE
ncbi:hypothetical protein B0G93_10243 [Bacillus sp. V-88]|nr:hypothetical protein B0G93_10243 [Bacillus sp. V-88]SLK09704.1 hypothetical protein SAMN06295884_10243 [Bacillus sp. V-88]